ncbi:MAG: hypothetical protein AAFZ15_32105 [Bacteroidota bacterium]
MLINELFDLLDDWRNLPAYQLERRADIFFALHLKQILEKKFQVEIEKEIIPEFPIRKGNIPGQHEKNNQSFKVDYLALSKDRNQVYLIELKTDMDSKNLKQDDYLKKAAELKLRGLINGLIKIVEKTRKRKKYNYLLDKVEKAKLIKQVNGQLINICGDMKTRVVYIQPKNIDGHENTIHLMR